MIRKYIGSLLMVALPLLFACVYVVNMEKPMTDEQAEAFFNEIDSAYIYNKIASDTTLSYTITGRDTFLDSVFNLQSGQGDTMGIYPDSIGIIIDLY